MIVFINRKYLIELESSLQITGIILRLFKEYEHMVNIKGFISRCSSSPDLMCLRKCLLLSPQGGWRVKVSGPVLECSKLQCIVYWSRANDANFHLKTLPLLLSVFLKMYYPDGENR